MNPFSLIDLNLKCAVLLAESQTVISLRLMSMAGVLPARRGENNRMVSEKGPTLIKAYVAGTRAALSGQRPDEILTATLLPLSRKVRANRKRLMKP